MRFVFAALLQKKIVRIDGMDNNDIATRRDLNSLITANSILLPTPIEKVEAPFHVPKESIRLVTDSADKQILLLRFNLQTYAPVNVQVCFGVPLEVAEELTVNGFDADHEYFRLPRSSLGFRKRSKSTTEDRKSVSSRVLDQRSNSERSEAKYHSVRGKNEEYANSYSISFGEAVSNPNNSEAVLLSSACASFSLSFVVRPELAPPQDEKEVDNDKVATITGNTISSKTDHISSPKTNTITKREIEVSLPLPLRELLQACGGEATATASHASTASTNNSSTYRSKFAPLVLVFSEIPLCRDSESTEISFAEAVVGRFTASSG